MMHIVYSWSKKFFTKIKIFKYSYRTVKQLTAESEEMQKLKNAKPFSEILGPHGFLGLGTAYQYLPGIGNYSWDALHEAGFKKYQIWGSIVRETIVPGVNIVWLFDPNDIATILNDTESGVYPERRSHLALEKYRKDRPDIYRTAGLLPTNGVEWWKIRSELQKGLSSPQNVRNFLFETDKITRDFIENLSDKVNESLDMLPELERLNLELLCSLAFDYRLKSFSVEEREPHSRSSKLIKAAEISNSCILPLDQGFQLWRLFETKTFKKFRQAQEYIESVAIELVSRKIKNNVIEMKNDNSPKSILQQYLENPKLEPRDIVGMASDLLLAGVDTTSYTTCFVLYYLAKYPKIQEKLFEEIENVFPNRNNEINTNIINAEIPYTRAILKETLRLNPISIGVGRILKKDTILSGYLVPKGTVAVTQNLVACRLPINFSNPDEFLPDRWLKSSKSRKSIHPHLVLPFGHGMRSCIARRLAEQNILVLILRLIQSYKLEWAGKSEMDICTKLVNRPDQPVKMILKYRGSVKL